MDIIRRLKEQNEINNKTRDMFIYFVCCIVFSNVLYFTGNIIGLYIKSKEDDYEHESNRIQKCVLNVINKKLGGVRFGNKQRDVEADIFAAFFLIFIGLVVLASLVYLGIIMIITFVIVHFENKLIPQMEELIIKLENNVTVSQEEFEEIAKEQKRVSTLSVVYASTMLTLTIPLYIYTMYILYSMYKDVYKKQKKDSTIIIFVILLFVIGISLLLVVPLIVLFSYIIANNNDFM